ncbi:Predicted arabinose efflux permease, MFS family [Actinacidiphila yanglinensis]|uniref:Predicted arabinose efflux permease, MFS family n=1 Tax=Actinacidiphila yanglinensis TaxID=310779 RepID=A0A1H6AZW0_9ACTN|nr:MFS transporter [Actinacidiphila yanglinensis]SEG54153.1 Predicted arabinose efflux permease, MFS family [Actinacidiphila yanglinensis]
MTTATRPTVAGQPRLGHNRGFRLLWIGQALSGFGSEMSFVALPLVLLSLGRSATTVSVVGSASLVAGMVARVPAGYAGDRYGQRRLMLGCDLVRLLAIGAVTLCVLARAVPLPLAVGAVAVSAAASEVFQPAQQKVVRRIVGREQIATALSLNQARAYAAGIVAPAVAGLLLGVGRALPFAVDTLTFAVSALCVAAAVGRAPSAAGRSGPAGAARKGAPRDPEDRLWRQLTLGWRYLARDRFLRRSSVYFGCVNLAYATLGYLLLIGLGRQPGGAAAAGWAMSTAAVAGLLGSLAVPQVRRRVPLPVILTAGPALAAALLLCAALTGSPVALAAGFSALCLLTPVVGAVIGTVMATSVPEEVYGRVITANNFTAQLLQPLGPLACGLLLARCSGTTADAVLAAAFGLLAVAALTLPAPAQRAAPRPADAATTGPAATRPGPATDPE